MKRILIIFLVIFCISLIPASKVFAEATNPTADEIGKCLQEYRNTGNVANCTHVFATKSTDAFWYTCFGIGVGCAPLKNSGTGSYYFQNSVLGTTTSSIAYMYDNKPASSIQFIAYYGEKLGIVKSAYAQGIGFSGLRPLMGIWTAFRNIAYGFLIIIMIIIGLMIMLRSKIDPRTVISIQNALPRIVVTLILITFSYAISGLLIDLMYICIYLPMIAIGNQLHFANVSTATNYAAGGPLSSLFGAVFAPLFDATAAITSIFGGGNLAVGMAVTGLVGATVGALVGLGVAGPTGAIVGLAIGGIGGGSNALVLLLITLALIFAYVRIFITLLSAYIQVILSVIFGPIQIMIDAIPNTNSFSSWLKGLIANLAVFPVTSLMLILGQVITVYTYSNQTLWTPPGIPNGTGKTLSGIISLGIVFIIPNMANSVKEMLKAKSIVPVGQAIGSSISAPFGTFQQLMSTIYYAQNLIPRRPKPEAEKQQR